MRGIGNVLEMLGIPSSQRIACRCTAARVPPNMPDDYDTMADGRKK